MVGGVIQASVQWMWACASSRRTRHSQHSSSLLKSSGIFLFLMYCHVWNNFTQAVLQLSFSEVTCTQQRPGARKHRQLWNSISFRWNASCPWNPGMVTWFRKCHQIYRGEQQMGEILNLGDCPFNLIHFDPQNDSCLPLKTSPITSKLHPLKVDAFTKMQYKKEILNFENTTLRIRKIQSSMWG